MAAPQPGEQALLAVVHLRNGDTYTRLDAGFGIGVATAWRYLSAARQLGIVEALNSANVVTHADRGHQ